MLLLVADEISAWRSAGFHVEDSGLVNFGEVSVKLVGQAGGGVDSDDLRHSATGISFSDLFTTVCF